MRITSTHTVKYLSFKENIFSSTNGFYFANSSTVIQEKPNGSKLRYYDYNGVFTYQPNKDSHEQIMTPDKAEDFVNDFKKVGRPGWKKIALNMEKQLENLKNYKISCPQTHADSISFELPLQGIQVSLKNYEKIIIKQLNTQNGVSEWVEIIDTNKIKSLSENIREYIIKIKPELTNKTNTLLANHLQQLWQKYKQQYC